MSKERKIEFTPYRAAWLKFRRSDEYVGLSAAMKQQGIKMPYRDNILKLTFAAGWNAANGNDKM